MATVVGVMDRDSFGANTDVIVVADSSSRELLWVPRDLWCERLRDRINRAFALGGHVGLRTSLAEHGIAVEQSVCLLPAAIAVAFDGLDVEVPVDERIELWYPLRPQLSIKEGRKRVVFEPPAERLTGERLHQWIGARYGVARPSSDLDRLRRQQRLVGVLLGTGFDFSSGLRTEGSVSLSSEMALEELREVDPAWRRVTMDELIPSEVEGKKVLRRL